MPPITSHQIVCEIFTFKFHWDKKPLTDEKQLRVSDRKCIVALNETDKLTKEFLCNDIRSK
uniref:Uncharacterized protein n=1 Tax=Octopus bimaculoides TaxID=37653 RepID=A0A0L8I3R4_OCTBM